MKSNIKKRIAFIGFVNDYEKIDLELLKNRFTVINIVLPKLVFIFFKKICITNNLYYKLIKYLLLRKISKHPDVDLYIFKDEQRYMPFIKSIKGKIILILRNTLKSSDTELILKNSFPIYSFDYSDVQKYHLNYYSQYSSIVSLVKNKKILLSTEFDFCFLGKNKGRKEYLDSIARVLLNKNYSIKFIVIEDYNKFLSILEMLKLIRSKRLSYLDYLKLQLSCKVVVDIVQENQSAETMRFIEALSTGRKVITNNRNVVYHKLYNRHNVLYFDSIDQLKLEIDVFMSIPFMPYSAGTIEKYNSYNVLSKIIMESLNSK